MALFLTALDFPLGRTVRFLFGLVFGFTLGLASSSAYSAPPGFANSVIRLLASLAAARGKSEGKMGTTLGILLESVTPLLAGSFRKFEVAAGMSSSDETR